MSHGSCPRGCMWVRNLIPSVCLLVMLSSPKPLDEIQSNLVCELHACMGRAAALFPLLGPGEGSKRQVSLNFNYKVNFKYLYTKLCKCSHK